MLIVTVGFDDVALLKFVAGDQEYEYPEVLLVPNVAEPPEQKEISLPATAVGCGLMNTVFVSVSDGQPKGFNATILTVANPGEVKLTVADAVFVPDT